MPTTIHACDLAKPLTVEIRDGETVEAALLRELRAVTATLRSIHNNLIGDDETPAGERLRTEVLEVVTHTAEEGAADSDLLWEVWRRLRAGNEPIGLRGDLRGAVRAELDRITGFTRSPLASGIRAAPFLRG
jgi:hypothetical protein